ncbi:MAG: hypothetical protein AAFR21_11085, partial [Pseudomonadota bacterium]
SFRRCGAHCEPHSSDDGVLAQNSPVCCCRCIGNQHFTLDSGFASLPTFNRVLKNLVGQSPTAFRRRPAEGMFTNTDQANNFTLGQNETQPEDRPEDRSEDRSVEQPEDQGESQGEPMK